MKCIISSFSLWLLLTGCTVSINTITVPANQSMSITGKGPGQDAAINPFYGQPTIAIVKNVGKNEFSIRIQKQNREVREEIPITVGDKKSIILEQDDELYFDAEKLSKARIKFKALKNKKPD